MKYLQPPFIRELQAVEQQDPERAVALRNSAMDGFFKQPAGQIITSLIQAIEGTAIEACRTGEKMEYHSGRLAAVAQLRDSLVALLPVDQKEEAAAELEGEVMEPFLNYGEGFDIPYPTRANEE